MYVNKKILGSIEIIIMDIIIIQNQEVSGPLQHREEIFVSLSALHKPSLREAKQL